MFDDPFYSSLFSYTPSDVPTISHIIISKLLIAVNDNDIIYYFRHSLDIKNNTPPNTGKKL